MSATPVDRDVEAISAQALEKTDPAERAAYLDRACGGDAALRQRVERRLGTTDHTGHFPESPSATDCELGATGAAPLGNTGALPDNHLVPGPVGESPGSRIGPYKLLQEIGQGGMGAVYMAEQEQPVRRRVALKIIKPGMDSAQVVARFEAERQALALMDHPNIARVFDAGTTDSGRPYFVMELVNGIPITDYCDQNRLTTAERLELFMPVCQAIQHAHQKGIIHRDVKPSNVLVTLRDGKPVPKVIDFGVAKAIDQRLTEKTMFTQIGSIVGTLEYMSPEQAEMSALGIDTRSDIYSLGVLLYELLTGTTPLERARIRESGYAAILRRIQEEEPPKPSTRLSESHVALPSISARRKIEPARLTKLVRGELDWIVMKALEKDRTRRYETANGFARDVERYLEGDPVEAGPPSTLYRAGKFARKHRAVFATAIGFALVLLLGAGVSAWQAIRAVAAETRARAGEAMAKRSAAEAQAVLAFMTDQILSAARPEGQEGGLGREVTIHKAVDTAEPRIAEAFHDKPAVEASIRITPGMTYKYLGKLDAAIRQLERAVKLRTTHLGPEHSDTIESRTALGEAYFDAGRTDESIVLLEPAFKLAEEKLGDDDEVTISTRNDLAMAYSSGGRNAEAISLHEINLKKTEARYGPDDRRALTSRNNLALAYWNANRVRDALALDEVTLKTRERILGIDHPLTLTSRNNLALEYNAVGRTDESIPMLETNLKLRESKLGSDHPDTLASRNSLAAVYWIVGRLDEARALLESALQKLESTVGSDHPTTLVTKSLLAEAYIATGQDAKAEPTMRDVLARSQKQFGPNDPRTAPALAQLGGWLVNHDRPSEAEPILRQCLAIRGKNEPDFWTTFNTTSQLGGSLLGLGKYAEAEPLILAGYEGLKARENSILPQGKKRLPEAAERVVKLYQAWGKPEKVSEWRARLAPPFDASKPAR